MSEISRETAMANLIGYRNKEQKVLCVFDIDKAISDMQKLEKIEEAVKDLDSNLNDSNKLVHLEMLFDEIEQILRGDENEID